MSLKTRMAADQAVFFNTDEFAYAAQYTVAKSGEIKNINVVIWPEMDLSQTQYGKGALALIGLKKSDIARPEIYDQIAIGSDSYRIEYISSGNNFQWLVSVSSDPRPHPRGL
jgi:hypothetical protein